MTTETTAESTAASGQSSEEVTNTLTTEAVKPEGTTAETETHEAPKVPVGLQRRMDAVTRARGEAERRAAAAEAEVVELRKKVNASADPEAAKTALEEAEIDRRAAVKAVEMRQAEVWKARVDAFQTAGEQEYPDFNDRCNTVAAFLDPPARNAFVSILTDIDDGHRAVAKLSDDPDLADRVLKLSPHRMAIELAKLASEKPEKPKKEVSKAPAPIEKVSGTARSDGYRPGMTVEEHVEWANKNQPYKY
jgi:hypothetical protein